MSGAATLLASMIVASGGGVPTFDPPITITFANKHFPTQPAVADFDEDGQLDLVVPGRDTDGLVYLVLRNNDGSFDAHNAILLGVQTDWAETADFDGDGHADIALAVRATFGAVALLRGHGDGTFDPAVFFPTERETRCVRVADMDRDGQLDLVAVNYGSNSIQVFRNLSAPGSLNFIHGAETRLNRWTVGSALPNWAALADTNQDGFIDIIDLTAGSGRLNARVNKGDSLGREKAWSAPTVANSTAGFTFGDIADLDRDGSPDVIAHLVTTNHSNPVAVWRGGSTGLFDAPQFFDGATVGTAFNITAADMDGDGDKDLIAMAVTPGQVSIIENRTLPGGPLDLAGPVVILTGDFPRHVAVLDFDHDGRPDIAVVDLTKHKMFMLRNAGFAPVTAGTIAVAQASSHLNASFANTAGALSSTVQTSSELVDDTSGPELAIALANVGPSLPRGFAPEPQGGIRMEPSSYSATCGPPSGDCLVVHEAPYCFTTPCCEIVCGFDPQCCELSWDADCVSLAGTECKGIVCPSRGACGEAHAGPGCEDPDCCSRVTRLDPSCLSNWDSLCVELSLYACIDTAPQVIAPGNAIDENEHCYERLSEGCGRRSSPVHVAVAPGDIRKGALNGDGARDLDAHLLTLTDRTMISLRLHADFPAQLVLAQGPCEGPLITYTESLAAAGEECRIDRILEPGEWRVTVGMATPMQALRYGQPCMEDNPDNPWGDNPPTQGFFTGNWWMSFDAQEPPAQYDLDGSGDVDGGDLGLVLLSFGEIESDYDLDGNGQVDGGDVGLVLLNFD
ncbi:MAG: VCBS repeat-containing protein [Planctomycetes bacterium]|nr:VCBS repeat-containing protein [Planctomycetota bacterium]